MDERYSVRDIAVKCGVSVQSIYKLIKSNDELSALCAASAGKSKGSVFYGVDVLEWVMNYYQMTPAAAQETPVADNEDDISQDVKTLLEAKEAELEALRAELSEAQEKIVRLDAERQAAIERESELIKQNGNILLLLGQAQNEIKLLSAPKQSIFQRIKQHFTKTTE